MPSDAVSPRQRILERIWIFAVLGWSIIRIIAVQVWLSDYGVNVWVYAALDFGSSVPYAVGSTRTVRALLALDTRRAVLWGLVATGSFVAPDVYVLFSGRHLPWKVYAIVGGVALIGGVLAVQAGRRRLAAEAARLEASKAG